MLITHVARVTSFGHPVVPRSRFPGRSHEVCGILRRVWNAPLGNSSLQRFNYTRVTKLICIFNWRLNDIIFPTWLSSNFLNMVKPRFNPFCLLLSCS